MKEQNDNSISLNKYISSTGMCSRREADQYIKDGMVTINGKKASLGNRVNEGDHVKVGRKLLHRKNYSLYIAFNKPIGIVSTTDPREPNNIIEHIRHKQRLFPIGRLDKPSEGLIFLTNDGDIVNKILRAGNAHEKEYIVKVNRVVTKAFINSMSNGIPILGTKTKPCKVTKIDDYHFKIILIQGLNRQIRRMCEFLQYDVKKLKRTRIMNVSLGKLKSGEWRLLTHEEINQIKTSISSSSKTEEASFDTKKITKRKPNTRQGKKRVRSTTQTTSKKKSSYSEYKKRRRK